MNVTNFANLFHQNNIFQPGKPMGQVLSQSPLTDTLHRLSENLLTAQDQLQALRKRFDTLELSAEATERKENSALRDVPEGLLHFYLNQCKVGAHLSQTQEASLLEYRDRLSAFDQTIADTDVIYDYSACYYPEGILDPKSMFFFNRGDIETVYFRGYEDQEEFDYRHEVLEQLGELEIRDGVIVSKDS